MIDATLLECEQRAEKVSKHIASIRPGLEMNCWHYFTQLLTFPTFSPARDGQAAGEEEMLGVTPPVSAGRTEFIIKLLQSKRKKGEKINLVNCK